MQCIDKPKETQTTETQLSTCSHHVDNLGLDPSSLRPITHRPHSQPSSIEHLPKRLAGLPQRPTYRPLLLLLPRCGRSRRHRACWLHLGDLRRLRSDGSWGLWPGARLVGRRCRGCGWGAGATDGAYWGGWWRRQGNDVGGVWCGWSAWLERRRQGQSNRRRVLQPHSLVSTKANYPAPQTGTHLINVYRPRQLDPDHPSLPAQLGDPDGPEPGWEDAEEELLDKGEVGPEGEGARYRDGREEVARVPDRNLV